MTKPFQPSRDNNNEKEAYQFARKAVETLITEDKLERRFAQSHFIQPHKRKVCLVKGDWVKRPVHHTQSTTVSLRHNAANGAAVIGSGFGRTQRTWRCSQPSRHAAQRAADCCTQSRSSWASQSPSVPVGPTEPVHCIRMQTCQHCMLCASDTCQVVCCTSMQHRRNIDATPMQRYTHCLKNSSTIPTVPGIPADLHTY